MTAIAKPLTTFTGSSSNDIQFVAVEQVMSCEKFDIAAVGNTPASYGILFTYINGAKQRILWPSDATRNTSLAAFIAAFCTDTA